MRSINVEATAVYLRVGDRNAFNVLLASMQAQCEAIGIADRKFAPFSPPLKGDPSHVTGNVAAILSWVNDIPAPAVAPVYSDTDTPLDRQRKRIAIDQEKAASLARENLGRLTATLALRFE